MVKHDFLLTTKVENYFWLRIRNQRQISRRMMFVDQFIMNLPMFPVNSILRRREDVQISGIVVKIWFQPTHSREKRVWTNGWVDSKKSVIYPYAIELQITCSWIVGVSNSYLPNRNKLETRNTTLLSIQLSKFIESFQVQSKLSNFFSHFPTSVVISHFGSAF